MHLRDLPSVDKLSRSKIFDQYAPSFAVRVSRLALAEASRQISAGENLSEDALIAIVQSFLAKFTESSLKPVINASGVLLHTGLGRARLAPSIATKLSSLAGGHASVELDLVSGKRGDRQDHVRQFLTELTGAEDALVVNNCAFAVVLALSATAKEKNVLLSRGQMVEIGGSFRMPDIVEESGCNLVEIGCTNKTKLTDYAKRLDQNCGAILRCHPSNYTISGFTEEPTLRQLSALAAQNGIPLIDDIGNGCILDTSLFGLPKQTTIQDSLAQGADLVLASGDKMLGGPQAGIIVGKAKWITMLKTHPLARAHRIDKLTLTALEETLRLYLLEKHLEIPFWKYLSRSEQDVRLLAETICDLVPDKLEIMEGITEIGGGSLPGVGVPTVLVSVKTKQPDVLSQKLRTGSPAVLGRVQQSRFLLDLRTVEESELELLAGAIRQATS